MTKTAVSEWSRDYELWKGHLKRVEGTQKGPSIIGNHIWMLLLLCFIEILKKKETSSSGCFWPLLSDFNHVSNFRHQYTILDTSALF